MTVQEPRVLATASTLDAIDGYQAVCKARGERSEVIYSADEETFFLVNDAMYALWLSGSTDLKGAS